MTARKVRRGLLLNTAILLGVCSAVMAEDPAAQGKATGAGGQASGLFRNQRVEGYADPNAWYHLWVPPSYKPGQSMPLYLFLHGGHVGEGTADNVVDIHKVVSKMKDSLSLFPNHLYWFWTHPDESVYVMTIMEQILRAYNVDRKRIYVIGGSMGGTGAMHFAAHFPEIFAACAPISCWCQYMSRHTNPSFLDTLALAYFENGRKQEAITTQKKALSLLPAKAPADMRKELEGRLKRFETEPDALRKGPREAR